MKFVGMSLAEVAAAVATHLKTRDIEVVVVGGSAITAQVPDVYTSMDIILPSHRASIAARSGVR